MFRLSRISVKNFRNIKDANVEFNDVNVVVGPNNSGKTNFVRVINFIDSIVNGSSSELEMAFGHKENYFPEFYDIIPLSRRSETKGSIELELTLENTKTEISYWYTLKLDWKNTDKSTFAVQFEIDEETFKFKHPKAKGPSKTIFLREGTDVIYGDNILPKKKQISFAHSFFSTISIFSLFDSADLDKEVQEGLTGLKNIVSSPIFFLANNELRNFPFKKSTSNISNGRVSTVNIAEEVEKIIKDEYKKEVFDTVIKEILNINDYKVNTFEFLEDNPKYLHVNQFGESKDISSLSDGSLMILALIVSVLNSSADVLFIEEPENSIHPKALISLMDFVKSFSLEKQFIITTHSIALINSSRIEELITAEVNDEGESIIRNISSREDLVRRLRKGSVSFSDEIFFANENLINNEETW